jgi:hypothetical protein
MLTLGEAYDLQSGQCLLETAKENEPLVIVHDLFRPPPTAAGEFDWTRHKVMMPDGADHGVGPIERNGGEPPRTTAFHKKATGRRGESEKHGGWLSPRERVLGIALPRAERLTRAVLSAWDFKQEQGWRPLLKLHSGTRAPAETVRTLELFAVAPLRQELASALQILRDVEYEIDLRPREDRTVVGVIDCLWRDEAGKWRLLAFLADGDPADEWENLRLGAEALARQFAGEPTVKLVFDLKKGRPCREPEAGRDP